MGRIDNPSWMLMRRFVRLPRYILRCISYRLSFFSLNKIKRLLTYSPF